MEAIALMFTTETAIAFPEVGEMRSCCGLFGGRSLCLGLGLAIAFTWEEVVEVRSLGSFIVQ
jgi:hypothetical protein